MKHDPRNLIGAAILAALVSAPSTVSAAVYNWTGAIDNTLNKAGNWLVGGVVPGSAPSVSVNGFDATPAPGDTLLFDTEATGWVRNPSSGIYMNAAHDGSLNFANGSYSFRGDGNSYRNRGNITSGITIVVGDGDATTAASVNTGLSMLNAAGTATKTYVVNSDGALIIGNNTSNNAGYSIWSGTTSAGSASLDTVIQIIGGTVTSGKIYETPLTGDAGDYVSFEALGSMLTFTKGSVDGQFNEALDVTSAFGDSFRLGGSLNSGNAQLQLTDNGTTWTIEAIVSGSGVTYATWSGGAAADADANDDGVANGLAFVLGAADVDENAVGLLPTLDNTSDATYVIFNFRRDDEAEADPKTAIMAQYGTTLSTWTDAVDPNPGTPGDDVDIIVHNDDYATGVDRVEVKLHRANLSVGSKLFARLLVVVTP